MFRAAPPPLGQETVVANVAAAAAVPTPLSYTLPEIKLSNLQLYRYSQLDDCGYIIIVTNYYQIRIEDGELVNMNDCMAYGQVTAPSQENSTSPPTEIEEIYDTVLNYYQIYI